MTCVTPCVSSAPADELHLLHGLRRGDERAFAAVYRRYSATVHSAAWRVLLDHRAAEDVAQEVFAYLWHHPERVDPERGTLRTFLTTIAKQRAIDSVRRESSRRRRHDRVGRQSVSTPPDSADVAELVTDADARTRRARELREAVRRLPELQRTSVELAYFEGRTYRQVAEAMGVPEGTAKSRLRMALDRLERQLDGPSSDTDERLVTTGS